MLSLSLGKIACISALGILPLVAKPDVDATIVDIQQFSQLDKDRQETLLTEFSRREWRKLSQDQRTAISEACYQQSQQLIGKNAKGQLKSVKSTGAKNILKIAGDYLSTLPADKTPAHPRAADLYGAIPNDAPRVTRSVPVSPSVVRWQATGLYAAPGEVVKLEFPQAWVNQGLKVQISGHRDRIPLKKALLRLPSSPARSFPVNQKTLQVAAAFGGAIYIDLGNQQRKGDAFHVKVSNALVAPYFVLGKSKVSDWKSSLRHAPAPYAELVSDRIALSFPSEWIRDIEDPTALLEYWDHVVALHDELGGMAHTRFGPERVNVDVQISVGLFHAGYPAQGPQKQCRGVVDLKKLKTQGNWGWFHEMGHESQRRPDKAWSWNNPYTFDSSIEVTVNLFSAHAMDRMKMMDRGGWSWTASPEKVTARAQQALSSKKSYPKMGAAEKLAMYLQLRDQFGWLAIQKVLTSYSADQDQRPGSLPKENQAKRDLFLVKMSKATGKNLTPFMQDIWGIHFSPEAVAQVKALPVWVPEGFKKFL